MENLVEEHKTREKFFIKWFKKKSHTTIHTNSIDSTTAIVKIPKAGYAEIFSQTRFAGENIWPQQEISCWNNLWVCSGLPAFQMEPGDPYELIEKDLDATINKDTGLARLVVDPAKKLLIAVAKKYNLFALYNRQSIDLDAGGDGKNQDSYSLNLAIKHPVTAKDMQRLYSGTIEFIEAYAKVKEEMRKEHADLVAKINQTIDTIVTSKVESK
jgi:hypothetical protein